MVIEGSCYDGVLVVAGICNEYIVVNGRCLIFMSLDTLLYRMTRSSYMLQSARNHLSILITLTS